MRTPILSPLGYLAATASIVGLFSLVACSDSTKSTPSGDAGQDSESNANVCGVAGLSPFDAGTLDAAEVAVGKSLVGSLQVSNNTCATCHAHNFAGQPIGIGSPTFSDGGFVDQGGFAFPSNLTSDPATGLGCWTTTQIVNAILYGVDNQGAYLCPPMPVWSQRGVTVEQAHAIAVYLQSLAPISQPDLSPTVCATPAGWSADAAEATAVDAGSDAASDSGNTDATLTDAASDGANADASPASDATTGDAASDTGTDAGEDGSTVDAATDAAPDAVTTLDAGVDSGVDSGTDAGTADAGLDAGMVDAANDSASDGGPESDDASADAPADASDAG